MPLPSKLAGDCSLYVARVFGTSGNRELDVSREFFVCNLIRACVRQTLEHCAMVAEDYVVNEDEDERLSGMAIGDAIAAELRHIADERRLSQL